MSYEPPYLLPEIPRDHNRIGPGGFLQSSDFVENNTGWRIDGNGYAYLPYVQMGAFTVVDTSGTAQMAAVASSGNLWLSVGQSDSKLLMGDQDGGVTYIQWDDSDAAFEFHTNGTQRFAIGDTGITTSANDTYTLFADNMAPSKTWSNHFQANGNYIADNPSTGTGNDAEWVVAFGVYVLARNSSLQAEKENISTDLGSHLTASMIDDVPVKMFNRKHSPNCPEIGFIAEDMDSISPFLGANGTDEKGDKTLTGVNKTGIISLLVLALQDARARIAALES